MIRHIVSWKLADADEASKSAAFAEISAALSVLPASLPQIRSLTVARNMAYPEKNFDVVLVADFASLDDLEAYQVSPQHIAAAEVVKARVSARASIDFEV